MNVEVVNKTPDTECKKTYQLTTPCNRTDLAISSFYLLGLVK